MSNLRYFDLSIPAPRRLAMMRRDFANHATKYPHCPEYAKPRTWRDVRAYRMDSYAAAFATLSRGENSGERVWYAHVNPNFRGERFADEIAPRAIGHQGWFTDTDDSETARGIVARLPHGRFIAGYYWTGNGERVYFPGVHDDERDAALMADEHARVFAELEREYQERCDALRETEGELEEKTRRLREALALRNRPGFTYARTEAVDLIAAVRMLRGSVNAAREALGA